MKYIKQFKEGLSYLRCLLHDRQHRYTIFTVFVLSIIIFIFSAILAGHSENGNMPILENFRYLRDAGLADTLKFIHNYYTEIIIGTIGIFGIVFGIIGILIVICLFRFLLCEQKQKKPELATIKLTRPNDDRKQSNILPWLFFSFIFLISIFITFDFLAGPPAYYHDVFVMLLSNSGGLFALVAGMFTLMGTYIAIQSIIEMKHTITSYPQLLERVTALIEKASDTTEGVRIISYSPLSGFWQVKSDNLKKNFEKKLANKKRKIRIICLEEKDHLKLLLTIARKRYGLKDEISADTLLDFQIQCNSLLHGFESKPDACRTKPTRLSWNDMPPYYFFVSDYRSIVVTPVGLPNEEEFIGDHRIIENIDQYLNANKYGVTESHRSVFSDLIKEQIKPSLDDPKNSQVQLDVGAHVETLGFETTDRSIIQKLQHIFDDLEFSHKLK